MKIFTYFRDKRAAQAEAVRKEGVCNMVLRLVDNYRTWTQCSRKMSDKAFLALCQAEIERRAHKGMDVPALTAFSNRTGLIAHLAEREAV